MSHPTNRISNQVLATVASLAIAGCFLSWRRQVLLQVECEQLREALTRKNGRKAGNRPTAVSRPTSDLDNTTDKTTSSGRDDQPVRSNLMDSQSLMDNGLNVKPIGVIQSIYRLCVGTPRQGLLAPNARGRIDLFQLGDSSPAESVDGLEGYSHIWIMFVFHLNTQSNDRTKVKSKITPPALGGKRVGIYATRTPHRYNPIGITLCKLDRIEIVDKKKVVLHISGLDLVDGTPVLDIKPFVPLYDSVIAPNGIPGDVRVPSWVEGGLATQRSVIILDSAKNDLYSILENTPHALRFYGPTFGESTIQETFDSALQCIRQVLAIDVRSSYQTKKSRSGQFQAERSGRLQGLARASSASKMCDNDNDNVCTQQLDNLLIYYTIREAPNLKRNPSENSGAEDILSVVSIELLIR